MAGVMRTEFLKCVQNMDHKLLGELCRHLSCLLPSFVLLRLYNNYLNNASHYGAFMMCQLVSGPINHFSKVVSSLSPVLYMVLPEHREVK